MWLEDGRMERQGVAERAVMNQEMKVPVVLLTGFLGAGKTTTLLSLYRNRGGIKIGLVVNDMAAVNVTACTVGSA